MPQDLRPFKNSNLFSNHYLEKLVKDNPEWKETEPERAYAAIKEIYERKARVLENYNESQLEENFIRPVLHILGHYFGVQGKVMGKDRTPDYAFFPDKESQDQAEAHPGEDYYHRAVAVGDAKSWKIPLDKSRKGQGSFEMQNPSYQIDVYLRDTPPKWAILTSGRLWRLYHETTSYKLDYYYEVDLPALLAAGDLECFKYFYLFFRREAFGQTVDGGCFLDSVREESVAYAQEIGEDLKENVYRAMKILAQGFLAEATTSAPLPDQAAVGRAAESSMRLLYRLLFIFYAESRSLLDVSNRYYYDLSLQKLKADVAARLDRGEPLLSVRYSYWESLKNLFSLINDGSESRRISRDEFYIPAYNGGLFDPAKNEFLEQQRIGDSFLARAIDLLARSHDQGQGHGQGSEKQKGFVDYSSLEIRHLGSIYEGLLEYRLRVAEQPMAAVKEKGKELWLPVGEVGKRKILDSAEEGEIYLATDKGERKATGSYYTPDYIVKYIVKNTIEPVVEKKKEEWLGTSRPFADYVLSIKVLDPAMGSGHFLVEATDQLARWLVSAWATARPEEADSKEVAEQDIHWARREVVRNCIYGVDLNPMAVELAKLSLWLTTVASNKPLSFLDHHLRCGNSLIGAELDRLTVLPGGAAEQTPLWSYGLKSHTEGLLKKYSLMAALPDDNLRMVKWKEDQFHQIRDGELSRRLAELSNVWLSTYFGNNVLDDDYYELQNHLSPEKFPDWGRLRAAEWFMRAQAMGREKRFFHWELEFPEAFQGEGRGFDVVVGNPPWIMVSLIDELDRNYYRKKFRTAEGKFDIYALFIDQGLSLLRQESHLGFVVSNKFLRAGYGKQLRDLILIKSAIEKLIDYSDLPLFGGATNYSLVLILKNELPDVDHLFDALVFKDSLRGLNESEIKTIATRFESSEYAVASKVNQSLINKGDIWDLIDDRSRNVSKKINDLSIPLYTFCSNICKGVWTGKKEVFVDGITHDLLKDGKIEQEIIMQVIDGRDIERYFFDRASGKYILYPYRVINDELKLIDLEEFPKAKEYLEKHRYDLEQRRNWGQTILEAGKKYYEIWNPSPHLQKKKLLTQDISEKNKFALDDIGGYLAMDTCYALLLRDNLLEEPKFLLSLLNSNLLNFIFSSLSPKMQGGFFRYKKQYLEPLPIRRISFTTPAPERARMVAELVQLYADGKHAEILAQVDACLPKDGEGNFIAERERSDVVHDLLAFLAERMLEMNKEKQKEIKGFLGWLEGYVGAKVEDLTPKTKLQSYYEHDYEGMMAVLKKNKKKLQVDPARRKEGEDLKAEFDGSMGKLGPLREMIRQTDELIDAVVYKLYALTQEEIGIVEGKAK